MSQRFRDIFFRRKLSQLGIEILRIIRTAEADELIAVAVRNLQRRDAPGLFFCQWSQRLKQANALQTAVNRADAFEISVKPK